MGAMTDARTVSSTNCLYSWYKRSWALEEPNVPCRSVYYSSPFCTFSSGMLYQRAFFPLPLFPELFPLPSPLSPAAFPLPSTGLPSSSSMYSSKSRTARDFQRCVRLNDLQGSDRLFEILGPDRAGKVPRRNVLRPRRASVSPVPASPESEPRPFRRPPRPPPA